MIKQELYKKTVDILVDAYFNDTLQHGYCSCCAVGNLVAAGCGYTPQVGEHRFLNGPFADWADVFMMGKIREGGHKEYRGEAKRQIDSTGYTYLELAKIEKAFEKANQGNSNDERMFNGLMAVIEVLDQIHQNTDTELTKSTKQKFIKC